MRSLADNYREAHSNNHETIADLVFCALVVLLLFVLALSVEVSQRVRGELAASKPVEVPKVEELRTLSPEEIKALSDKLQTQQREIADLKSQLSATHGQVKQQMAALAGEQRFTGAREPAAFTIVYDYRAKLYYFAPSKDMDHADRRQSGESPLEYITRKLSELAEIALKLRKQRGFTEREAQALYTAATTYKEVVDGIGGYQLQETDINLYYHVLLSSYVAGDTESTDAHDLLVTRAISKMNELPGPSSDQMYPRWNCQVDVAKRAIEVNGVRLRPVDLREILLSVSGRGLMLDFTGYAEKPPEWLYDEVLMPAGYISKTPKLPTFTN